MNPAVPQLLFAPYYNNGGTGEFVRSVVLAQAAQRRWPEAKIEFLLPGGPDVRDDCPFPHTFNHGHADKRQRIDFLAAEIVRRRPHLAVFDCYCAPRVLDRCREVGTRSAYIADQASTRARAFRWRWLRQLDAHWQQREILTEPAFAPRERLLSRLGRAKRLVFDTCFDDSPADLSTLPASVKAMLDQPFALLVAGGGGYRIGTRWVGDVFHDAAERLHARTGIAAITVLGALHQGDVPQGATTAIKSLTQPLLIALLRRAAVAVTNGGNGMLHQALSCGVACVAAPLGGEDQPGRIAAYAKAGLILESAAEAGPLADAAAAILSGQGARLRKRVAELRPVNGIPLMIDAIEQQLRLRR